MMDSTKLDNFTDSAKDIIKNYRRIDCYVSREGNHNVITDSNGGRYFVCEKGILPAYSESFWDMYPRNDWMADWKFAMLISST